MPPPMTSIRCGTRASSSADVESRMRGSSGMNGSRTTCEPAAMIACAKRTTFLAPVLSCPVPVVSSTSTWCASSNWPRPRTTSTLRAFAMPVSPVVSLPTTFSFQARSVARSTVGVAERDTVLGHRLRLVDDGGHVQQRLRRNAADVEAHPAERRVALDEHRLHAEVGRAERRAVAAGAGTQHQHLALDVGLAGVGAGRRCRHRCGRWSRRWRAAAAFGGGAGASAATAASSTRIRLPSLTLSPTFTRTSFTVPAAGDGHVHRRLVRLERDERILRLDRVARLYEDLDDRNVGEAADVGNLHLDRSHGGQSSARRRSASNDA